MKWFPQDWMSDPKLSRCSPATRGIWADAICAMMLLGDYKLEGTNAELARGCRCSAEDIETAHKDLERTNAADVSEQNGCKIWVCRRLKRTNKTSALRAVAGKLRWSKPCANTEHDPSDFAYASSASASASASASGSGGIVKGETMKLMRDGVVSFYDRHPDARWNYEDERLLVEVCKRPQCVEELADLRNYERASEYFPKSVSSLLTGWEKHLDAARAHKRDQSKGKPKSLAQKEAEKILKIAQREL
jgi:hypothetical protein